LIRPHQWVGKQIPEEEDESCINLKKFLLEQGMALFRTFANQKFTSQDMMKAAEEQPENERAIKIRITIIDEIATSHETPST